MKRRNFFANLVGLPIAAKLIVKESVKGADSKDDMLDKAIAALSDTHLHLSNDQPPIGCFILPETFLKWRNEKELGLASVSLRLSSDHSFWLSSATNDGIIHRSGIASWVTISKDGVAIAATNLVSKQAIISGNTFSLAEFSFIQQAPKK
jgi:hypothetical protein